MGPGWVHEIKHDGYQLVVYRDGPTARLFAALCCSFQRKNSRT
jgi:hypothetical protein